MATSDKYIYQLPIAERLNDDDLIVIQQGEYAKQYPVGALHTPVDDTPTLNSYNAVSSNGVYRALESKIDADKVGAVNGIAGLDAAGKVPLAQLPSYVDDVVIGTFSPKDSSKFRVRQIDPSTPSSSIYSDVAAEYGKLYIEKDKGESYYWSGSEFVKCAQQVNFDDTPTPGSENPVTSSGVYNAVASVNQRVENLASDISESLNPPVSTSGDTVDFTTQRADTTITPLVVGIEPQQDLKGYEKPWPGGGGKNLAEFGFSGGESWEPSYGAGSGTATANSNGTISFTGTFPSATMLVYNLCTGNSSDITAQNDMQKHLKNGTYIASSGNSNTSIQVYGANSSGNSAVVSIFSGVSGQFTIDDTYAYNYIRLVIAAGTSASNSVVYPMIRLASNTDETFEPYANICPINGWTSAKVTRTGRNLIQFPEVSEGRRLLNGITSSVTNGELTLKGTATAGMSSYIAYTDYAQMTIGPYPAGTYSITCNGLVSGNANDRIVVGGRYEDNRSPEGLAVGGTRLSSDSGPDPVGKTIKIKATGPFKLYIWNYISTGTTVDCTVKIWMVRGTSVGDYEPYAGDTYDVTFDEAGTVYGGTLDVTHGVLTVDRKTVDLSSFAWSRSSSYGYFYTSEISDLDTATRYKSLSSMYPMSDESISTWERSSTYNYTFNIDARARVYVRDPRFSSSNDFKAGISGGTICYKLAKSQSYHLTPQQVTALLGENFIFADCGPIIQADYRSGSSAQVLTIDDVGAPGGAASYDQLQATKSNIASIQSSMEALKNSVFVDISEYSGVDLEAAFADEIANYASVWDWLKRRLADKNITGIHIKDYIKWTSADGYDIISQVAGINPYLDGGDVRLTAYHIDFVSRNLWPEPHQWNKANYNNGLPDNVYPYLCSDIKHWLNGEVGNVPNGANANPDTVEVDYSESGVYPRLPDALKAVIVEKRVLLSQRYNSSALQTDDAGRGWKGIGNLWLPAEVEVFDRVDRGTPKVSVGSFSQYPIFRGAQQRVKTHPDSITRRAWWLANSEGGSGTNALCCGETGIILSNQTSLSLVYAPICFRVSG